jgi:spermidine synthase
LIIFSAILLTPNCIAGGLAFNLINSASSADRNALQACYAYESLGSLTGGLVVSIIFIYFLELDNLKSLQYITLLSIIFFGITDYNLKKFFQSFTYLIIAIGFMHLIYNYDYNLIAKKKLFASQNVIFVKETPYANLVITETGGQYNIYENGILSALTDDAVGREEGVHFPMMQKQNARKVLLIGGSVSGHAAELLKYVAVERIDLLEVNPELFEIDTSFSKLAIDARVHQITADPVVYLNHSGDVYDVIIIVQPSPANVQTNRCFTVEFFRKARRLLHEKGILCTSLNASANYLSDIELQLHSTIYNSLAETFSYVMILPGSRNYFLASDDVLEINYNALLAEADIQNDYFNNNYLDDDLLRIRSSSLMEELDKQATVNHDFKPVAYLLFINHWLSHFGVSMWILLAVGAVLTLFFVFVSKPAIASMFTSGFTGAGAEVVLIIAFQVIFGYAYLFVGLIITAFMAGLAAGAYFSKRCEMKNWYKMLVFIQLFSGIYLIVIALKLTVLRDYSTVLLLQTIFIFMTLIVSTLVGLQYGTSVRKSREKVGVAIAQIYAADLIGAALGSLLVVFWLIPTAGLLNTMILLGGLHFLTILLVGVKHKMKYF